MLACEWLGEILYSLPPRQKNYNSFLLGILFVSFYKIAESVTQQIQRTFVITTVFATKDLAVKSNLLL